MIACLLLFSSTASTSAQNLQSILQTHVLEIKNPSRNSVSQALDDLAASGLPQVTVFLEQWAKKNVWQRDDNNFVFGSAEGDILSWTDIDNSTTGVASTDTHTQVKPNGGVRRLIATALVQFQLLDPDLERRKTAVASIARRPAANQLNPLLASIAGEIDAPLKARKIQLANFMSARFAENPADRITAINSISHDTSVEAQAVLNQILTTQSNVALELSDQNIKVIIDPFDDPNASYLSLVNAGLAPASQSLSEIRQALEANLFEGRIGGVPIEQLSDPSLREVAYAALAVDGLVTPLITQLDRENALNSFVFYTFYTEPNVNITAAAETSLGKVEARVATAKMADLALDALSLASIFFLAAVGLAITFGVMGVINMAHGEFIMLGAYTGYVVQLFIPNYTVSIIVALPVAFLVTFAAGIAMERLVIRWLYNRPLETLLATFGISIVLQQLAKNIFGTQARPLTSPDWLAGAWVLNDVIQISYIRIAIFVLALIFLGLILYILKRTRLGLEVRAVTQNPAMAASMGINPDQINMLTFGLGSGIAGIAGVAIGLYAKVTSEMGSDYIVQSFMTVVVGGVGNVWGTLAGALMIGFGQKGLEWFNPSNTLAAQTYMIIFVILFIQFRPKGIVALKGRAAGD